MAITWPIGQQKRRYWRLGDDQYKVISGRVLLGEKVSILRYGFIGETLYYDVQVIGGKKSAILNSNCIRNMAFIGLDVQPSLVSFAASKPGAPTKPVLSLDNGARLPPSASVKNGVASKTRVPPSRSGSGGSPTPMNRPNSGAPAAATDASRAGSGGSPSLMNPPNTRMSASRAGSGGSPTPMNRPNFGAPAGAKDKAGFLLCAHGVRTFTCSLCQGKAQNPKPGANGAAAGVQEPTLDITTATSPAIATGPGPSFSPTSEKASDLTSGPFGPASCTRANSPSGKDPTPVATGAADGVQSSINKNKVSPRIKHPPQKKSCSKSSNPAVSDRIATLRSRNKHLNPPQVSSAARPASSRAVVPQIAKKSVKLARARAKKNTELKTTRANKKKVCQRNSVNRARKCQHNRRATRCPVCVRSSGDGFRSLCHHLKQKGWCTQCKIEDSDTVYYGEARR